MLDSAYQSFFGGAGVEYAGAEKPLLSLGGSAESPALFAHPFPEGGTPDCIFQLADNTFGFTTECGATPVQPH